MNSHDLHVHDATAQAELVRSGEVSPVELVEAAIAAAERLNPELNAIIHEFYDQAREEAEGDLPDGPFRGVPFLRKDLGAPMAGEPMHLGMQLLKDADFRSPVDSYLGIRFRDAGFVTIGKTNTPELGIQPTTEPKAYGATHNPWNLDHTPGGSSGGSGAAVAAGIVPVAHANDGGGSIRIPASHNGLVGLKPTRARTSQGPLIGDALSGLTEELVVAHSVRDVAAILEAVHGPAPGRPLLRPGAASPVHGGARGGSRNPADRSRGRAVRRAGRRRRRTGRRQEGGRAARGTRALGRHGRSRNAPGDAGQSLGPRRILHDPLEGGAECLRSSSSP